MVTELAQWYDFLSTNKYKQSVQIINFAELDDKKTLNYFTGWNNKQFPIVDTFKFDTNNMLICENRGLSTGFKYLFLMYNTQTGLFYGEQNDLVKEKTINCAKDNTLAAIEMNKNRIAFSKLGGSFIRTLVTTKELSTLLEPVSFVNSIPKEKTMKEMPVDKTYEFVSKIKYGLELLNKCLTIQESLIQKGLQKN